ncbi:DUF6163 family protein [Allorhizobium sonneratiae]|uniref:DUF6163 family protein n=1 Tax=Allorhizobium sonneratiae TaxID=2934936 RepID=UPI003084125B
MAKTRGYSYSHAMMDDSVHASRQSLTGLLFVIFLRIVATACLVMGLQFWSLLIGYSGNGLGRFDLLSVPWRLAASSLSVIFPVAAVGLWMAASWGAVVWLIAALIQCTMYGIWSRIFGSEPLLLVFHALVALVYLAFQLVLMQQRHSKASAALRNDLL